MSDISLRLPLIKPYEALKSDYWTVRFHSSQSEFAADHILVDPDRFIVGYGANGTTEISGKAVPYMFYFVIDLKNKIEMPFNDSAKFLYELNRLGYSWSNLVLTDSIYSKYHETGLIPWLSPQK